MTNDGALCLLEFYTFLFCMKGAFSDGVKIASTHRLSQVGGVGYVKYGSLIVHSIHDTL
jgi:hypothetical protein